MHVDLDRLYERYNEKLALASALLMPIKLSFCYFPLITLVALWMWKSRGHFSRLIHKSRLFSWALLFAAALFLSALFGIDPLRSLKAIPNFLFFVSSVLVFRSIVGTMGYQKLLSALLLGQSIAGLHSVLVLGSLGTNPKFNRELFWGRLSQSYHDLFIGAVSESGQLAMSSLAALGLFIVCLNKTEGGQPAQVGNLGFGRSLGSQFDYSRHFFTPQGFWGLANLILLVGYAFHPRLGLPQPVAQCLLLGVTVSLVVSLKVGHRLLNSPEDARRGLAFLLVTAVIPILAAALLVNLKRGPWAGVMIGGIVLLYFYARKLLVPMLVAALAVILLVEPLRTRLLQSSSDFFMAGGRGEIWEIGLELSTRFPLGVGFRNSPFLQKFSPEIPPQMKHFHNNLINILVEGGWIALGIYVWWMLSVFSTAFMRFRVSREHVLVLTLGCALLSWQAAGFVEYNFGDSEVRLIAFMLMGILSYYGEGGASEQRPQTD